MASFTGLTVQITLKQPPNTLVHGRVQEVIAGQTLTLQNVFFPATGTRWPSWTVQGTVIADLQVIEANTGPATTATPTPTTATRTNAPDFPKPTAAQPLPPAPTQARTPTLQPTPQRQAANFVDPAILSYGKSPAQPKLVPPPVQIPVEVPATPIKAVLTKAAEAPPADGSPFVVEPARFNASSNASQTAETAKATQQQQTRVVKDSSSMVQPRMTTAELAMQEQGEAGNKKKVRRGQKKKATPGTAAPLDPPTVMNIEVSRDGNDMNGSVRRGKGWRNTPLLQPSPHTASPGEPTIAIPAKENRRQRGTNKEMQQNGWATEDATDVQDMGDFDFEASNKLFDKKGVFDQLRQDDTTADEDRLVSHNKLSRAGTYGGKNLHPTENVLSPKVEAKPHNEVDSTSDADTELNLTNGRSSSRHSLTRASLAKKQPSRQSSTHVDGKPHPLDRGLTRSVTSFAVRSGKPAPSIAASSPRPERGQSPLSAVSAPKSALSQTAVGQPSFILQSTNAACPVLHPHALETLEAETVSRFGLTHDAITESAARCVAEVAMTTLDNFGHSRRGSRADALRGSMTASVLLHNAGPPVIVILAGNHHIGARAAAAARHLVCRKTKIILAEALYESTETQDAQMRTQTAMLKRMMKAGASIKRGGWRKASNYIKNLTGPPTVIIDALLAGSTYESLLVPNAQHSAATQKEAREMIDWANRSRAPVLSIGCPSGVSGTDGSATLVEGEPLAVRPDKILSLGAPMPGLLEGCKNGERWSVILADIGINITLRSEEVVEFGGQWVTELKFVEDDDAADAGQ